MTNAVTDKPPCTVPLSILLIEDEPHDARMVEISLRKANRCPTRLCKAESLAEACRKLPEDAFDLVLLDLGLPDGHGVENVRRIIAAHPDVPIVVLTGLDDDGVAMDAVRAGAQDYLVKNEIEPRGLETTLRFATERHRLRRLLEEAGRRENEVKDRFLSHVSHELRTPLTAVMQFVAILREGIAGPVNDRQAEYLDVVRRNAEQLKHMIGTLMDVTRSNVGKLTCQPVRTGIADLIRDVADSLRAQSATKDVRLELRTGSPLPEVVADPSRVEQVLVNLIDNAIKYTPAGGTITVTAEPAGDEVVVSVRDTGCGIPAEACERVFDRLYQVDPPSDVCRKGLGLGLHICREIVALHGGRIWVESRAGAGSTFRFTLPSWSLARYVRRVAAATGAAGAGVGVIALTVRPRGGRALGKGVVAGGEAAARLLEKCMIGLTDVVLPLQPNGDDGITVHGLARSSEAGMQAIAGRVAAEFERHPQLGAMGFDGDIASSWFPIAAAGADAGVDASIEETTRRIASAMHGKNGR